MHPATRTPVRRIVTIADGVRAVEVQAPAVLPSSLDHLLRLLVVTEKRPLFDAGTRQACTDEQHDYRPWLAGVYARLELRLTRCAFCGTVEVRDTSFDLLPGVNPGRLGPRRRNEVLGWYSGARPAGRTYL